MLLRSLLPTRLGLRGPGLRAHALRAAARSTIASPDASQAGDDEAFDDAVFDKLFLEDTRTAQSNVATKRVLEFLHVRPKFVGRVLASDEKSPFVLPNKTTLAPAFVSRLTPLVRWSFQQYGAVALEEATAADAAAVSTAEREAAADAVFAVLLPHTNMSKTAVWRHYFLRQFFLSGAPLRAYLHALKSHQDGVASLKDFSDTEDGKDGEDEEYEEYDDEEALDDVDEANDAGKEERAGVATPTEATARIETKRKIKRSRNRVHKTREKFMALIQSTTWDWVSPYVASSLVKEYCLRGRFMEAIEAYAALSLSDTGRQQVVQLLEDYEQFPAVLYLYEVHRAMGANVKPLDAYPELNALKHVGRMEEMDARFQELSVQEQSRADLQKLMDN